VSAPIKLTTERCGKMADGLEHRFQEHGLAIDEDSDLGRRLRELRWLAQFESIFEDAVNVDRDRAVGAFRIASQAEHVYRALTSSSGMGGVEYQLRRIRSAELNAPGCGGSSALEYLFELEVGGSLRTALFETVLEEPDIRLKLPVEFMGYSEVGLACKRPRSARGVARNLGKAANQIRASGVPGVAIVSLDGICAREFHQCTDQEDLSRRADEYLGSYVLQQSAAISRALGSGVVGVLFCCRFVSYVKNPSCWAWCLRVKAVPDPSATGAGHLLEMLRSLLLT